MRDEYLTEIILSRKDSVEPVIVYRLRVNRYDCKPFSFSYRKVSGRDWQIFWNSSPNYYSLGIASKRMLSRANRDLRDDPSLFISRMHYTETTRIVRDLHDYYEVKPNGKVRMIR